MVYVCIIWVSTIFQSYHLVLDVTRWSMASFDDLQNDHAPDAWNITPSSDIILTLGQPVPKFYPVNHSAKWGVAAFACTLILLHLQAGWAVTSSSPYIYHSLYVFLRKKITLTLSMISIMDATIKPCRRHLCDVPTLNFIINGIWKEKKIFRTMVNFSFYMVIQPLTTLRG